MQEPKEDAEEQDATVDGDGPVHGYSRDDGAWRPKGEEDGHEAVGDGENVDGDAETAEVEGTPAHDARRGGESFQQQHRGRNEEGGVEGRDDEAGEGVERCRRADVDEREQHVDDHGETDRPQRQRSVRVNLLVGLRQSAFLSRGETRLTKSSRARDMLTRARWADPGRPFSRAKAHVIRELVARHPMTPNIMAAMIKEL